MMAVLAGCAPTERGATGEDKVESSGGAILKAELRADPEDFALSGRRETKVVFSLRNISRQTVRLDFPTEQHWEVTLRGPDARVLFLWSEDRTFAAEASQVVVNPRERLEFETLLPTRDMVAGRVYTAEAVLPGHPETAASVSLRPR